MASSPSTIKAVLSAFEPGARLKMASRGAGESRSKGVAQPKTAVEHSRSHGNRSPNEPGFSLGGSVLALCIHPFQTGKRMKVTGKSSKLHNPRTTQR